MFNFGFKKTKDLQATWEQLQEMEYNPLPTVKFAFLLSTYIINIIPEYLGLANQCKEGESRDKVYINDM